MTITWTSAPHGDLVRLYEFLRPVNQRAAAREVRYILVGDYEIRYEISANDDIWILGLWHTREFR